MKEKRPLIDKEISKRPRKFLHSHFRCVYYRLLALTNPRACCSVFPARVRSLPLMNGIIIRASATVNYARWIPVYFIVAIVLSISARASARYDDGDEKIRGLFSPRANITPSPWQKRRKKGILNSLFTIELFRSF